MCNDLHGWCAPSLAASARSASVTAAPPERAPARCCALIGLGISPLRDGCCAAGPNWPFTQEGQAAAAPSALMIDVMTRAMVGRETSEDGLRIRDPGPILGIDVIWIARLPLNPCLPLSRAVSRRSEVLALRPPSQILRAVVEGIIVEMQNV